MTADTNGPVEIAVRGRARRRYPSERAKLTVWVGFSGSDRSVVYQSSVDACGSVIDHLKELSETAALITWSSDTVRVNSYRPTDGKGRRLNPVYSTRIPVRAEFADFSVLSDFVDRWAVADGVEIGGVTWDVTTDNRLVYEAEIRRAAVADAIAKAQAYADAVGAGPVRPVRLADPDANDVSWHPARMMEMSIDGAEELRSLELRSEDIEVEVTVDARFHAPLGEDGLNVS